MSALKVLLDKIEGNGARFTRFTLTGTVGVPEVKRLAAALVKHNTRVRRIEMSSSYFNHRAFWQFAPVLREHPQLQELVLCQCQLGDHGVAMLASIMRGRQQQRLCLLDVSSNGIGDEGMHKLADMLADDNSLRRLVLRRNGIGSEGVRALVAAFATNYVLISVEMAGCPGNKQWAREGPPLLRRNRDLVRTVGGVWSMVLPYGLSTVHRRMGRDDLCNWGFGKGVNPGGREIVHVELLNSCNGGQWPVRIHLGNRQGGRAVELPAKHTLGCASVELRSPIVCDGGDGLDVRVTLLHEADGTSTGVTFQLVVYHRSVGG
jgi:hypothetical protein